MLVVVATLSYIIISVSVHRDGCGDKGIDELGLVSTLLASVHRNRYAMMGICNFGVGHHAIGMGS